MDKKWVIILIALVIFISIAVVGLIFLQPSKKCGDSVCQADENTDNCCIDCGCYQPGYVCNNKKNTCEYKEISLTDDRAMELAKKYFEDKNLVVNSTRVLGIFTYQNQLGKSVIVNIEGEEEFRSVLVMENETVVSVPTHGG
jgi:hypothetical protein